jgi:hypothetical protein
LFVSTIKIWSFQNDDSTTNHAKAACVEHGLELAKIENAEENTALQEMTSTKKLN